MLAQKLIAFQNSERLEPSAWRFTSADSLTDSIDYFIRRKLGAFSLSAAPTNLR